MTKIIIALLLVIPLYGAESGSRLVGSSTFYHAPSRKSSERLFFERSTNSNSQQPSEKSFRRAPSYGVSPNAPKREELSVNPSMRSVATVSAPPSLRAAPSSLIFIQEPSRVIF